MRFTDAIVPKGFGILHGGPGLLRICGKPGSFFLPRDLRDADVVRQEFSLERRITEEEVYVLYNVLEEWEILCTRSSTWGPIRYG